MRIYQVDIRVNQSEFSKLIPIQEYFSITFQVDINISDCTFVLIHGINYTKTTTLSTSYSILTVILHRII